VIRRGAAFYEWKYLEENRSKYKTTKVPRGIQPKDALDLIVHEWLQWHREEIVNAAWELTEEEIAAGKRGIPESVVLRDSKGRFSF